MSTINIPPIFNSRKEKILKELSVPDEEYTDLSPKGSVDEGIRCLIRDINELEGLVTTSSCAGRISIFCEGSSNKAKETPTSNDATLQKETSHGDLAGADELRDSRQFASTGGKGSGEWLFVSHDPLYHSINEGSSLHEIFGLQAGDGSITSRSSQSLRLVRFHFEPMVSLPPQNFKSYFCSTLYYTRTS